MSLQAKHGPRVARPRRLLPAAAAVAAAAQERTRKRRRQRAQQHGQADEFMDMNVDVDRIGRADGFRPRRGAAGIFRDADEEQ